MHGDNTIMSAARLQSPWHLSVCCGFLYAFALSGEELGLHSHCSAQVCLGCFQSIDWVLSTKRCAAHLGVDGRPGQPVCMQHAYADSLATLIVTTVFSYCEAVSPTAAAIIILFAQAHVLIVLDILQWLRCHN